MSEEVTIEVDGQSIPARKGEMLMEATDRAGIYIPRFCYHKHLSVAANCRMCLVEVERAPKPLPACATPVMDGMKVFTQSEKAVDAQRGTMEFLLINHPLDCPICDQGGECELQDLAMGYGSDVGRYNEGKRVVRDKDVGPLIKTDMTRCIHCTRCVRFGEEIAGLRELGATGRGEHMQIGTYIERSIHSELSGNVIDLCPVGALTNRPYRYSARAWELRQGTAVSPHDGVGANLLVHHKGPVVKRVVPADNATVNETWIADRDRYSVHGLQSEARLARPRVKFNGTFRDVSWDEALAHVAERLESVRGSDALGVLLSPSASSEEGLLLSRLAHALGTPNIDHRLRHGGFPVAPRAPRLGASLADLETAGAVLLVGAHPRHEVPVLNIRLRKAALTGGAVMRMASASLPLNYDLHSDILLAPQALTEALETLANAAESGVAPADPVLAGVLDALRAGAAEGARGAFILLGEMAQTGALAERMHALAARLARAVGAGLGELAVGGNAAGLHAVGAVPGADGRHAASMLTEAPLPVYLLSGFDPVDDTLAGDAALRTLGGARSVIALTSFVTPALEEVAQVLLPIAEFPETDSSRVNLAGMSQRASAVVRPPEEARPGWKVLRRLGEMLGLPGFDFVEFDDVHAEVERVLSTAQIADPAADSGHSSDMPAATAGGLTACVSWPMHAVDLLTRHSAPLAATMHAGDDCAHFNAVDAARLGLLDGGRCRLTQGKADVEVAVRVGAYVAPGAIWMFGGRVPARALGLGLAPIEVTSLAQEESHA